MSGGQADRGLEYLERAVEIAPDIAAIRTQLALGQFALGDTVQGISEMKGAVELGQGVLQAVFLLVIANLRNWDYDRALAAAEDLT